MVTSDMRHDVHCVPRVLACCAVGDELQTGGVMMMTMMSVSTVRPNAASAAAAPSAAKHNQYSQREQH